jgi:hypothetical protein
MLPPKALSAAGSPEERRLARLYRSLESTDRRTLIAFAEFLAHGRRTETPPPLREPNPVPRPDGETVIAAIRRLSLSYDMLDREPMLHETSALMSTHVLQGRAAAEVIDQLEALFERHYEDYRARLGAAEDAADRPRKPDL